MPIRRPVRPFSRRYGAFDMDSMPPATATSYSPAWIALPTSMTARMPEPQTLWTVTQGTVFGIPAAERRLAGGRLADAGLQHVAEDDLLDLAGRDAGARERGLDRGRAEGRGGQRGELAEKRADRSPGGREDDDVFHRGRILHFARRSNRGRSGRALFRGFELPARRGPSSPSQ